MWAACVGLLWPHRVSTRIIFRTAGEAAQVPHEDSDTHLHHSVRLWFVNTLCISGGFCFSSCSYEYFFLIGIIIECSMSWVSCFAAEQDHGLHNTFFRSPPFFLSPHLQSDITVIFTACKLSKLKLFTFPNQLLYRSLWTEVLVRCKRGHSPCFKSDILI